MPNRFQTRHRHQLGAAAVVILVAMVTVGPAGATEGVPPMPRVRSNNSSIAALIVQGRDRSITFRRLLETIEASDGIVYIEPGQCHGRHACLLFSLTVAGPNRILHVRVDTRATDRDLLSSIAHELQHAIEVLSDSAVTSDAAIYYFFVRNYPTGVPDAFETEEAIKAGRNVRAELSKK
jgi:hypothetical protein